MASRALSAIAFALPVLARAAALPAVDASVARLDCANLSAEEVAKTLVKAPAPRIIALHGSVPIVTMEPFAAFLEAMGYPNERLTKPGSSARSYSSFIDSRALAGRIAWHYEQEGLMPIPIGHSQGGMIVIKMLHDLAATRDATPIPVWDPTREAPESRTTIVDPLTGRSRPVVGLTVDFAAALVTGSLPRLLLGQWGILPLLRDVPDSVRDFTGFAIPWDPIAGTGAQPAPFRATGSARVRNVVLPSSYSHVMLPDVAHLAKQPETRAWIEAWRPDRAPAALPAHVDTTNLVHAAELWYSIKRHWCEAAQRLAGAQKETR